ELILVAKVNGPFPEMARLSPPLSCRTSPVPVSPVTEPPIEYCTGGGLPPPPPPPPLFMGGAELPPPPPHAARARATIAAALTPSPEWTRGPRAAALTRERQFPSGDTPALRAGAGPQPRIFMTRGLATVELSFRTQPPRKPAEMGRSIALTGKALTSAQHEACRAGARGETGTLGRR